MARRTVETHARDGTTGDLFEHFGVPTRDSTPARVHRGPGSAPPRAVKATACRDCGWLRPRVELARAACPLCGRCPAQEDSETP